MKTKQNKRNGTVPVITDIGRNSARRLTFNVNIDDRSLLLLPVVNLYPDQLVLLASMPLPPSSLPSLPSPSYPLPLGFVKVSGTTPCGLDREICIKCDDGKLEPDTCDPECNRVVQVT